MITMTEALSLMIDFGILIIALLTLIAAIKNDYPKLSTARIIIFHSKTKGKHKF